EMRYYIVRKALGVLTRQGIGQIAHLQQQHEVPHAHSGDGAAQRLAYCGGAAGDDKAMLDKILPGKLGAQRTRGPANLRHKASAQRGLSAIAWGIGKAWIDMQTAVEEVIDMGPIETLRFLVVIGHHDDLRIAS